MSTYNIKELRDEIINGMIDHVRYNFERKKHEGTEIYVANVVDALIEGYGKLPPHTFGVTDKYADLQAVYHSCPEDLESQRVLEIQPGKFFFSGRNFSSGYYEISFMYSACPNLRALYTKRELETEKGYVVISLIESSPLPAVCPKEDPAIKFCKNKYRALLLGV